MGPLWLLGFRYFCFHAVRRFFNLIQGIWWRFNGTHGQIQAAKDPANYSSSARVSSLIKCYIFDPWMTTNSASNLISTHERFVHPEYVLKDEVSLYCVTDTEAFFVEAPPGVEVWKSKYSAFHRIAQHKYSVNVISMPLTSFYRLADELGEVKEKLIFLDYIGRSGSTFFGQIFEETGVCVNYSEPSMLNMFFHDRDNDALKKILQASIRFYTKPRRCDTQAFIFKFTPMGRPLVSILHEVYPNAHFFHLTRNAIPNIKSSLKVIQTAPFGKLLSMLFTLSFIKNKFLKKMVKSLGFESDKETLSALMVWSTEGRPALFWIAMHSAFIKNQKNASFEVPSVKYEDLLSNPRENIRILFKRCGLGMHLVDSAMAACNKDSQDGSPLARNQLRATKTDIVFDPEFLARWGRIAERRGIKNWTEDFRIENTITKP